MPSDAPLGASLCRDQRELPPGHPVHPNGRKFRKGCGDTWRTSSNAAHCNRCHQTFGSPAAADLHDDTGEGRCRSGEAVGLVADINKWGTTIWRRSVPQPPPA